MTWVQAVPAIGNTGQLATDLLIVHLQASLVAVPESVNVLPVVGNAPVCTAIPQGCAMCSALELYQASVAGQCVTILQQRGSVATGRQAAFAAELVEWIKAAGFADVLLLSSTDASERRDKQILGSQLAVLNAGPRVSSLASALASAGVPAWEEEGLAMLGAAPQWQQRRTGPWCALGKQYC